MNKVNPRERLPQLVNYHSIIAFQALCSSSIFCHPEQVATYKEHDHEMGSQSHNLTLRLLQKILKLLTLYAVYQVHDQPYPRKSHLIPIALIPNDAVYSNQ